MGKTKCFTKELTKIEKSDSVFCNAETVKRTCYCSLARGVRKTEIIRRQVQSTWSFNKKHKKKTVKKFTTAWMNGLDKTFPNMRCRSLNNCLRHLCSWKCSVPESQWWWWLFFPNQPFFSCLGPSAQFLVVTKCVFTYLEIYT